MKDSVLEFRKIMENAPILFVLVFLLFFTVLLYLRRRAIARRSSGPFFAPFHINRGIFYIHVALCFSRRRIPLKEIKQITFAIFRGRSGGGLAMLFISSLEMERLFPSFLEKASGMKSWWRSSNEMQVGMGLKYMIQVRIQSSVVIESTICFL